jgi:hypothetical protein
MARAPRPRPRRRARALPGRSPCRRPPRAGHDGPCHRRARRSPVGAHGVAPGARRARARLLHELREPQGRRAGREPVGGRRPQLGAAATGSGARRGARRASSARRVHRLLPHAHTREPTRRVGVPAVPATRGPGRARATLRGGRAALRRLRRRPSASVLGRLQARAGGDGALGEPAEPTPRPRAVRAGPRRLEKDQARALSSTTVARAHSSCTAPTRSRAGSPSRPGAGRRGPAASRARGRSSSPGSTGSAARGCPSAAA